MKKFVFCLILGFTAGIVFGQANVPAIVVSTFSTRGQAVTADDAESITELFMAELAKQSGVRVVDRTRLDRVVAEMRFQTSDWSNSQKTARLGEALNAEVLVRGQINQLGQQISVAITALDIKTLEVVSSSTQTFDINTIYDAEKDGYYDYQKISIFGKMPSIAGGIAIPIKTKMVQLSEQRKKEQEEREKQQQEQARLQEQSRYSLNREWYFGNIEVMSTFDTHPTKYDAKSSLSLNRWDNYKQNYGRLTFKSDGTVEFIWEDSDIYNYTHYYLKGRYTRQNDILEISLSGTKTTASGKRWWSRNGYEDVDYKSEAVTVSNKGSILFRNNGNELVVNGIYYINKIYRNYKY